MMVRSLRLALPAALLLLAGPVLAAQPQLDPVGAAKLAPALVREFEAGDASFQVIVHLAAPPEASLPLTPPGVPLPRLRLETVHEVITQELGKLMGELPPDQLELRHTLKLQPIFVARVGRAGLAALSADPAVTLVEKELILHAMTGEGVPLIHGDVLHTLGYTGAGTAVAVIDSGVDYNHPSLGGGVIPNGKIVFGTDVADNDSDPMDCDIHGTAVASIVAGLPHQWEDGKSFAGGVAPGASILAYKASPNNDCGNFTTGDMITAVDDATDRRDTYNVVAINLSVGGGEYSTICDTSASLGFANVIRLASQAGIAVVVASGNENKKAAIAFPGCFSSSISVGSVYDTSLAHVSYCGNDTCTETLCDDPQAPASSIQPKTVPCYSNSSRYLDLLAPSELLTAAAAGGEILLDNQGFPAFGGTSGATPYVAGAIALLSEAIPSLGPARARILLADTGEPITDTNSIAKPLIDLQAAFNAGTTGLGQETYVEIPNAPGEPATSTAVVTKTGQISAVHVRVQVAHDRPTQIAITLIAPNGTRIKLHDHSSAGGGVFALYPDEDAPAESLDALLGLDAAGAWTLEVLDDNPASTPAYTPVLIGWSIRVETAGAGGPPTSASHLVPVGAHKAGFNSTFWSTDMRILNPSATQSASFNLYLIQEGDDGTSSFAAVPVTIAPDNILRLDDVVQQQYGLADAQGNLVFNADGVALVATSRTFNSGGATGTYGQFVGMVPGATAIGSGNTPLVMPQLASNSAFRTNIGFSEAGGKSAQVRITLRDGATGAILGSPQTSTLPPFSNLQINKVFPALGAGSSDNAYATAEVIGGQGRIEAYATVVDEATGDAIYVPGAQTVDASAFMVPIVASATGKNQTFWVSDLRIFNGGASDVTVAIVFRPELGVSGGPVSISRTIGAGQVLALDDVVHTALGLSEIKGTLRITRTSGTSPLLVTTRTYNRGGAGTFGQFVGALTGGFSGAQKATVIHLDKTSVFRSNLGIAEVNGGTVTVRYTLKDATGATLGTKTATLGPYQVIHVNDVFADLGVAARANTRVDLALESGNGAFTAYGTLVDNTSGDAIYIPAAGL